MLIKHRRVKSTARISTNIKNIASKFHPSPSPSPSPEKIKHSEKKKFTHYIKTEGSEEDSPLLFLNKYRIQRNKKSTVQSHKVKDFLNHNEITSSKRIITEIEEMRKSKMLRPQPKQWQFHHCLNLQKI